MPYAKPLFALLAGTALLAPLPAMAQGLPRLPSLPSLPGADRDRQDRPARTAPSPRPAPNAAAQAKNRELIREFSLKTQMLTNQINTSTVSEDDNQRIDREVEEVEREDAGLTPREIELLELFAKGESYKEAARTLGISPLTVGNHVKSIYRKLAVQSRGEAVYEAMKTGQLKL